VISQVISYDGKSAGFDPQIDGATGAAQRRFEKSLKKRFIAYPPDVRGEGTDGQMQDIGEMGRGYVHGFEDAPDDNSSTKDYTWYLEVCAFCVNELDEYVRMFGCVRFNFSQKNRTIDYRGDATKENESKSGFDVPPEPMTRHFSKGWGGMVLNPSYHH